MIIGLTLLIALVGLLMFVLCTNPKLVEIGKIMFFCGLLAFLLGSAGELIKLVK